MDLAQEFESLLISLGARPLPLFVPPEDQRGMAEMAIWNSVLAVLIRKVAYA